MASSSRSQILWSYTSTLCNSVLMVVAAATITRFVAPSEYGLVALAMLCCRFPNYLSQLGMSRAVVQKPDLSEGNIRAAFTLSMGLGLGGFLAIVGLAPPAARFFHEPRLRAILTVLSMSFLFQGATLVSGGLLRRALRMRELALADIASYFISTFAIGLPIAIRGLGAWAIVAATVTQWLFLALFYYAACRHTLWPTFKAAFYSQMVGFGGKATGTSIIEGLGSSMDTLMLGRFSTAFNVGLYNRSFLLIQLPVQNVSSGLTQVLFSRFSRAAAQKSGDSFDLLARFQQTFLAIVFPLCAGAAAASYGIVLTLYGPQWTLAIPVYTILCTAAAAEASAHLPAMQMEALGIFRHKVLIQSLYAISIGAGVFLAIPHGLLVVGMTLAGLLACRSLGLHFFAARYLNRNLTALVSAWLPGLTAALPVWGAVFFVARFSRNSLGLPLALQLVLCILTGLGVSAIAYAAFFKRTVFDPVMALLGLRCCGVQVREAPAHA